MSLNVEEPAEDVMVALNDDDNKNGSGGDEVVLNDDDNGDNNDNDDEVIFGHKTRITRPLPAKRGRQRQPCWR